MQTDLGLHPRSVFASWLPVVMVPMAVHMEVVMAGDVVIVMAVPHPFARVIIPVARIVPGMTAFPTKIPRPMVTNVAATVVGAAEVDMVTGPGYMEGEVTSLRFVSGKTCPGQARNHRQ